MAKIALDAGLKVNKLTKYTTIFKFSATSVFLSASASAVNTASLGTNVGFNALTPKKAKGREAVIKSNYVAQKGYLFIFIIKKTKNLLFRKPMSTQLFWAHLAPLI